MDFFWIIILSVSKKKIYENAPLLSSSFFPFLVKDDAWFKSKTKKNVQAHSFVEIQQFWDTTLWIYFLLQHSLVDSFFFLECFFGEIAPFHLSLPFHPVLVSGCIGLTPVTSNMHVFLWSLITFSLHATMQIFCFSSFFGFGFEPVSLELYNLPHFSPKRKTRHSQTNQKW